ncbi:uncharacterized protein PAC_04898 [Phialocephala subalpina]|uniref:CENP-V/GFA domain-containing protein n=1 Tax=Phialocephala subalpina TaxID=576137 RepID=A0A1L7WQG1_9HELO|nr:uncharacterized protein PAC_04898 [Phialocephala subalpina]
MASQEPTTSPTRRPYTGSCHCGHTKYITYLTIPPANLATAPDSSTSLRIRKCNCTTCHKMSFFHIRLPSSPSDFLLLSPLNPVQGGLNDYTCFDHEIHWYFCPTCGVRCFAFNGDNGGGDGEVVEVELETEVKGENGGKVGDKVKVWKPKTEGWIEGDTGYFSVNAHTLDAGQEGLDLRDWTEKGWILYLDMATDKEPRFGRPHDGGIY